MLHLEDFYMHLKSRYYKAKTIINYKYVLGHATRFLDQHGKHDEKVIAATDILKLIAYIQNEKKSEKLLYLTVINLKKYFRFLEEKQIIFISPLSSIVNPKEVKRHRPILEENEIQSILDNIKIETDLDLLVKSILELLYSSALRPGEAARLKISDIDFKSKILYIRKSKNNKDRVVPAGEKALYWIKQYMKIRSEYLQNSKEKYLFISLKNGRKLNTWEIWYLTKHVLKKQGLPVFTPATLRPTAATHLLNNGMGILHIQKLLGHSNVNTTKIYLRINLRDLRRELEKKHPRNNMGP